MDNREALYTFISTGDKFGFYTLRVMEKVRVYFGGESRVILKDFYITNLSTDSKTAEEKAQRISEEIGIPFKGDADFDLEEIKRRQSEVVRQQKEAIERAIAERQQQIEQEFTASVNENVFIAGKYIGQTPSEVYAKEANYLFWLANEYEEGVKSKLQVNAKIAKKFIEENDIQKPGYIGEEGEEVTVSLTLKHSQWTNSRFPSIMFICLTEKGEEVMFFTVAKKFQALENGNTFTIKGTVKEQRESYSGNKQTIINKPKMV